MTEREMARKKAAARKERERKARNRRVVMTVALMLVVCVASIGGTIAWLTDETEKVTNTFTSSDIKIELTETKEDFKMVPGSTIAKDPKVTVKAGSEKSWVFVKIEESASPKLSDYITYTVDAGWKQLKDAEGNDVSGVYYRIQEATTDDVSHSVLTDDEVTVNATVTKIMMENIDGKDTDGNAVTEAQPTLSFTAYAVQYSSFEPDAAAEDTAAAEQAAALKAWNEVNSTAGGSGN